MWISRKTRIELLQELTDYQLQKLTSKQFAKLSVDSIKYILSCIPSMSNKYNIGTRTDVINLYLDKDILYFCDTHITNNISS